MQQRNLNVYATAHLSGDVANAVTLLKRMTRPSSRKHKAGLLIASTDIAACQVRNRSIQRNYHCAGIFFKMNMVFLHPR